MGEERTDVDVAQGGQAFPELVDGGLVSLDLLALSVLGAALLLGVETQVLEQDDLAVVGLVDRLLDLLADAVAGEDDALAEQLLELAYDGLQAVLGVGLAIWTAEMRHQDHGLGAGFDGMLDGGEGTDDALVVGDVGIGVEGDVEVDLFAMLEIASSGAGSSLDLRGRARACPSGRHQRWRACWRETWWGEMWMSCVE